MRPATDQQRMGLNIVLVALIYLIHMALKWVRVHVFCVVHSTVHGYHVYMMMMWDSASGGKILPCKGEVGSPHTQAVFIDDLHFITTKSLVNMHSAIYGEGIHVVIAYQTA